VFPKLLLAGVVSLNSNMAGFPKGHLVITSKISTTTAQYMIQTNIYTHCIYSSFQQFIYLSLASKRIPKMEKIYRKYNRQRFNEIPGSCMLHPYTFNSGILMSQKM